MKRTPLRSSRAASLLIAAVVTSLAVATLAGPAGARAASAPGGTGAAPDAGAAARLTQAASAAAARPHATSARSASAATAGSLKIFDPPNDPVGADGLPTTQGRADILTVGLTYGASSLRLSAQLGIGTNPTTDAHWRLGATGLVWLLDTNNNGTADYGAVMLSDTDGRLLGAVVANISTQNATLRCLAKAAWDGHVTYTLAFPAGCIGKPASVAFGADMTYDTSQGNAAHPWEDLAPNGGDPLAGPVTPSATVAPDEGGMVVDGFGGLHFFGIGAHKTQPSVLGGPYWNGLDIARGVAVFPAGAHGYVLDGFGGLHGFSFSPNQNPGPPPDGPYWNGRDIARSVTMFPDGRGGVVLDGLGGLHPFSIGTRHAAPALSGAPYWGTWDIARGVAVLPDGTGGWVLDGFGGLHFFSIGAHRSAPRVIGAPYWNGWDIARGVTILPDGTGGYVIDGFGGMHFFSIGTPRANPGVSGAPYWNGWAIAHGASVIQGVLPTA